MKQLESLGYEFISFCDDVFTIDRRRIVKFCEVINNNNLKVKWGCSTRADAVDYELLKLMKDSGCIDVRFGVESGSNKILEIMENDKKIKSGSLHFILLENIGSAVVQNNINKQSIINVLEAL